MRRVALILCLLCVAGTTPASAQEQVAPPGNAGVDEYLETIPEAEGNRPARPSTEAPTGQAGIDARTRRELESLGDDGEAAARLADDGIRRSSGSSSAGTGAGSSSAESLDGAAGTGIGAALGQTVSAEEGGMGVALPILLAAALLGAVAIVVLRRRSRP